MNFPCIWNILIFSYFSFITEVWGFAIFSWKCIFIWPDQAYKIKQKKRWPCVCYFRLGFMCRFNWNPWSPITRTLGRQPVLFIKRRKDAHFIYKNHRNYLLSKNIPYWKRSESFQIYLRESQELTACIFQVWTLVAHESVGSDFIIFMASTV